MKNLIQRRLAFRRFTDEDGLELWSCEVLVFGFVLWREDVVRKSMLLSPSDKWHLGTRNARPLESIQLEAQRSAILHDEEEPGEVQTVDVEEAIVSPIRDAIQAFRKEWADRNNEKREGRLKPIERKRVREVLELAAPCVSPKPEEFPSTTKRDNVRKLVEELIEEL